MRLVPVPTTPEYLNSTFPLWSPFLAGIAKRSKESVQSLLAQVARHEVQPILVMDESPNSFRAVALLGVRYHRRDNDLIAELVWLTGAGMKQWRHLLADLEKYLTEHVGVAEIRPICRPGWAPFLKQRGYRVTHYTLEKHVPAKAGNKKG